VQVIGHALSFWGISKQRHAQSTSSIPNAYFSETHGYGWRGGARSQSAGSQCSLSAQSFTKH
jgi:hypothetical protein